MCSEVKTGNISNKIRTRNWKCATVYFLQQDFHIFCTKWESVMTVMKDTKDAWKMFLKDWRYPIFLMSVCTVINLLYLLGFLNFSTENDVEVMYTPSGSQAYKD